MKFAFCSLVAILPLALFAQTSLTGYGIQQVGIEHNPLKNPTTFLGQLDTVNTIGLTPSPFYSYSKFYLNLKYKWNRSELGLKPRMIYRYYPSYQEANHLQADLQQYFNHKLNKRWKVYQLANYRTSQRNQNFQQDDIFLVPRSYDRITATLGAEYKPNRNWEFDWNGSYIYTNYQTDSISSSTYWAWELNASIKRRFRKLKSLKATEVGLNVENRDWTRGRLQDELEWTFTDIQMQYWELKWSADFEFWDQLEWEPFLSLNGRLASRESLNWNSVRAGFKLSWETDDFDISWSTSIADRSYPNFYPDRSGEIPLHYVYFRNSLILEYFLSEQWSILLNAGAINRSSNVTDETRLAFRSYDNYFIRLGLKLRI